MKPQVWFALGLVTLVVAGWASGAGDQLELATVERWVRAAGPLGPVAFVLIFAVAELLHVPALLFILGAAAIWPLPLALAIAYAGTLVAAVFVVFVARFAVGELVRKHLLHRLPARLQGLDERLAEGGLRAIIVLRLTTFMLPAAHWVVGVSNARARDIVWGTAIGLLPGVVVAVVLGRSISEHWEQWWPYLLGAVAGLALLRLGTRWRRRRREAEAREVAARQAMQLGSSAWDGRQPPASGAGA